jgi:hypothetical protein
MSDLRITCITPDGGDHDRRIDAVGGADFYHTIDQAISFIRNGTYRYWTHVGGRSVWVQVAHRPNGVAYLKTENDGFPPNNLLSLPACR